MASFDFLTKKPLFATSFDTEISHFKLFQQQTTMHYITVIKIRNYESYI